MASPTTEGASKCSSVGYPAASLDDIPTPLRARPQCHSAQVCVLDVCPWDSLAQFLTLPELEWVCCASASLHKELTIEEKTSNDDSEEKVSSRKLLAPLLVLKVETAEAELQRVSLGNIRAFRIWKHQCLEMLTETVADAGGPQVLRSLERIKLTGCPLGPEVISSFIVPAFSHGQLKHMNLEKNQVSDEVLCNLVKSGALDNGTLESINLRFNRIGSKGAQALASSPCCASLKWVNLKMNQVGDDGAIAMAEMLHGNSSMSLLNLRRQTPPLTDRSAFAFAAMLKHNSTLEQLRLRLNKITDGGAAALAAEVAGHVQRLQVCRGVGARFELDLEQNKIKETGATALLESLSGISRAVRVELLLHGNPVKRETLQKTTENDTAARPDGIDGRLAFDSKAEGLLW